MAHGDCLMQAVRTVFNIAIGSESPDIQNTARSALLQARLACMWGNAVCRGMHFTWVRWFLDICIWRAAVLILAY